MISVAGAMAAALLGGAVADDVHYQFEIARAKGAIYNPWTKTDDKVELRSFLGMGAKSGDFVAPTIRVAPGQRLNVAIDNKLEACSEKQRADHLCFNDTNLHTHGLWVSPSGNSDNVMISIPPGGKFQYRYDISADHPAGTFWYHPHQHGAGFVQVGSGMAGALIVTGNRLPTATRPGDIDVLLKDERGRAFPERVMVFQQIQYGCFDAKGAIEGELDKDKEYVRPWTCSRGKSGGIESFEHDWDWVNSGRFTGINGKVQPSLPSARVGAFERWRLIHAGTRERIRMRLHRLDDAAPELRRVRGADQIQWMARYCTGARVPMWQIAMDGLTRSDARRVDEAVLFPGERMDVVVRLPEPGRYCVMQDAQSNRAKPLPLRVLATIEAKGRATGTATEQQLLGSMALAAQRALPGPANAAMRGKVLADLRQGMKLAAFAPHRAIAENEVSGYREAIVNVVETPKDAYFQINGRPYDHGRIDHLLPLGKAEEWRAISLNGNHPLHIHVNPFQIVSIMNAAGDDVTDPASPAFDPDFAGVKGEWKDTVMLKQDLRVAIRTRYERFTGDFVTHCHIMFHGDHGMMQNLRIAAEAGEVSDAHAAH